MSQAMTDIKIEISSDGTSSQSHEQTPVQATPAAASPHNENTGVNEMTPEIDLDRSKLDLYNAAVDGRWGKAQSIYEKYPDLVSTPLNASGETALHVAVREGSMNFSVTEGSMDSETDGRRIFVEELVNRMTPQDLEIRDAEGKTAFHMAVLKKDYHAVRIMIEKNQNLPAIAGPGGMLPIHVAASSGYYHKIVEEYMWSEKLLERMDYKDIERLFFMTISSSMYDMAKKLLLYNKRELSIARDDQGLTALHRLARKHPKEFGTSMELPFFLLLWDQVSKLEYNQIVELITKPSVVLFDAVKSGNHEIVKRFLFRNRELMMMIKDPNNRRNLLHYAVLYRQRRIFNDIFETNTVNHIIRDVDNDGNNVLHFAAKQPEGTSSSSNPNFQMLEAVVWLKEVAKKVPPGLKKMKNKDGKTPTDYAKHKMLSDEREKEENREDKEDKEENREDNTNIHIEISSDGTSSQSHEQTPVEATPAAASPHNENVGVNEITAEEKNRLKYRLDSAAFCDRWDEAQSIYEKFRDVIRVPLDASGNTALHVAVSANSCTFVEELVNRMNPEDLKIPNKEGKTAFYMAVLVGNDNFLQIMIEKNQNLPLIPGPGGILPVHLAASSGYHKIVRDLCSWNLLERMHYKHIERLFFLTISSSMYDVATELLDMYPAELATARDDQNLTVLHMLTQKHSEEFGHINSDILPWWLNTQLRYIESDNELSLWVNLSHLLGKLLEQVRQLEYNEIVKLITKPSVVLFEAVKSGNDTIVQHLLEMNRELMMIKDRDNGQSLLHYVVLYRQRHIFNFILKMKTVNVIIRDVDNHGNNVLHFAAHQSEGTSSSSSPNSQMQEAVKWLKEVKNNVPHELQKMRNKDGKTPIDIFYEQHKELSDEIKDGDKESANYGMIVATLIASITFAAALTVPGEKTNAWFIVFTLTNAVGLFTASMSIILFLSMFISSRFRKSEFVILQHPNLTFGLMLVATSILAMVMTFVVASFLTFDHISKWVAYVVALIGVLLIVMFFVFQLSFSRVYVIATSAQDILNDPNGVQ